MKCNVSKFNNTKNPCPVNENPSFKEYSIAMNIISPVLCAYVCVRPIISQCCASYGNPNHSFCKLVKYLKYKTESSTRNKIMANIFKKIVCSDLVATCICLCSIFSLIESWTGITISLGPAAIVSLCIFLIDCYYAVQYKYSTDQQLYNNLEEDIAYLHALYKQSKTQCLRDLFFVITETAKISDRQNMFKSLIRRGQFSELLNRQFTFDQMLDAGVRPNFLQDNVVQLQPQYTRIIGLQTAIVKKDAVAQHWQDHEVQAALQAVLLVVLRTAGVHPNVLQDAITAQHNAGQDAALQALQAAIAHVQAHVVQPVQDAVTQPVQNAIVQFVQAAVAQPVQDVLRDVLEAVLLVALRTAGVHPNVLQDAITAQHNAGQDAALQALQNAIAHVLQPMQGPVVP